MAEEPQPSPTPPASELSSTTENDRTAASLSNLSSTTTSSQDASSTSTFTSAEAALNAAVSNLSIASSKTPNGVSKKTSAEQLKNFKVEVADVTFLTSELEVSKTRATELLRMSGGDRGAAVRAFVVPGWLV